jgi:bifunctional hydroxylase/dehydrase
LDIRYPVGDGDHPLLGRRLPPRPLGTGTTFDLLHAAHGVFLDLVDDPNLRAIARRWKGRVAVSTADSDALGEPTTLLVRPDGYVAWAGERPDELDAALRRWFGEPVVD